jgi:chemotaxis protein MotB
MRLPSLFPSRNTDAGHDPASGVWLITFTDLVGLMLAFFIMMYAMSKTDEQRWARLAAPLGATPGGAAAALQSQAPTEIPVPARGRATGYLAALLPRTLAEQPALAGARLVPGAGRIDIVLPPAALLKPGTAELSASAQGVIDAVVPILANLPNAARIEARLGGRALQPQAWTQAAARVAAVASAVSAAGYTRPLEARAYLAADAVDGDSISFVILE